MFDNQSQMDEAQATLDARNRIADAWAVFRSQIDGEVQAGHVDPTVGKLADCYGHDMLAEFDGVMKTADIIVQIQQLDGYDFSTLHPYGKRR